MSVDVLLSRLSKVRKSGPNKWMACCPAHDDRSPSLAIAEPEPDKILIHCFAGCELSEIIDSVGLSMSDLFPERDQYSVHRETPNSIARAGRAYLKSQDDDIRAMETALYFYEKDVKSGVKFSLEDRKKYMAMYKKLQQAKKKKQAA